MNSHILVEDLNWDLFHNARLKNIQNIAQIVFYYPMQYANPTIKNMILYGGKTAIVIIDIPAIHQ